MSDLTQARILVIDGDPGFLRLITKMLERDDFIIGRFLEVNPAFEKQTGLRDAVGKRMRELAPNHESHWFEIYGKIALTGEPARFVNEAKALTRDELPAQRAARGFPVQDFEFSLVFDDGTIRNMLGYGTPLRDGQGRPRGAVHALVDISARKHLQNEVLEISEHEQRRFGCDLHDGLGSRLTGLEMLSHTLAEDLNVRDPELAKQARRLNLELRETVRQVRLLSHGLAPVPLGGDGLVRGLRGKV